MKDAGGNHRIYGIPFARIYPLYIAKAEKKGRTKSEVNQVICWLTGHTNDTLRTLLDSDTTLQDFFAMAPNLNPARRLITGVICGVRVEEIKTPLMQEIRYLDKLIDELARGKSLEKIFRTN